MRLKTKHKIIADIKEIDPETDITVAFLEYLSRDGYIRSFARGNRVYYDLEYLIRDINYLLGMRDRKQLPRIRTVHGAYSYTASLEMGLSRQLVCELGKYDYIPSIHIGNRTYVALESFDKENEERLTNIIFEHKYSKPSEELQCSIVTARRYR